MDSITKGGIACLNCWLLQFYRSLYASPSRRIPDFSRRLHNDASGNLILEGDRLCEYEAWGRLVKVSIRGTLVFDTPPANEQPELEGAPGRWLVHYTYDALGRLIRKQTPVRDGAVGANEQLAVCTERYFYDGARRVYSTWQRVGPACSSAPDGLNPSSYVEVQGPVCTSGRMRAKTKSVVRLLSC